MITRRGFLGLLGGAVAAVAGGLAGVATGRPIRPVKFGAGKPYEKWVLIGKDWPAVYSLAVKLPQPKNRPLENPAGINYWIQRPTEIVKCLHVSNGFYVGEHRGMKLRAIAERQDGILICKHTAWDGEWDV